MVVVRSSAFRVTASADDLSGSSFGTAPEFVRGIFATIARRGHEVRAELVWWEALWCASIGGRRSPAIGRLAGDKQRENSVSMARLRSASSRVRWPSDNVIIEARVAYRFQFPLRGKTSTPSPTESE
jgi:hypothetical protein